MPLDFTSYLLSDLWGQRTRTQVLYARNKSYKYLYTQWKKICWRILSSSEVECPSYKLLDISKNNNVSSPKIFFFMKQNIMGFGFSYNIYFLRNKIYTYVLEIEFKKSLSIFVWFSSIHITTNKKKTNK